MNTDTDTDTNPNPSQNPNVNPTPRPTSDADPAREPSTATDAGPVLVLGGTGKTGRRVAARLTERGVPVRVGSRAATPPFEWTDPGTWDAALTGARAAYIAYAPDISAPGAPEAIGAFAERAAALGVRRLVLLSARGMAGALRSEEALRAAGTEVTILRCGWFAQNFSEEMMLGLVLSGALTLPGGDDAEPFLDAEDIADVAVAALLDADGRHAGRVYALSGPRSLTLHEVAAELSRATGREVRYVPVTPGEFAQGMIAAGQPSELAELVAGIFAATFDGTDVPPSGGVREALGREARDFADYARRAAATGVWDVDAAQRAS